jgi:transcriptional regulator with XRE-family HTH domain
MIQAHPHARLTRAKLAIRMGTTEAVIDRLESSRTKPSTRTLERLAEAAGMRLRISFKPIGAARRDKFKVGAGKFAQTGLACDFPWLQITIPHIHLG